MISTGSIEISGPVWEIPNSEANTPSWKTSTTAPKDAPIVSRNPPIAVSGTRIERNAIISRISARPTTTARYGSSEDAIRCETSMFVAVCPVTSTGAPNCAVADRVHEVLGRGRRRPAGRRDREQREVARDDLRGGDRDDARQRRE